MDDANQEPLMEEPSRSNADDILVRLLYAAHTPPSRIFPLLTDAFVSPGSNPMN